MASAAASHPPAPPPPPPPPAQALQWLGPRVSFSLDDAGGGGGGGGAGAASGGGKPGGASSTDFEFLLAAGCSAVSMLPADELFSGGKLVPLRIPAPASASTEEAPGAVDPPPMKPAPATAQQPETPRGDETATVAAKKAVSAAAGEEPKIPVRRWRDLLRLRKQQASSSSAAPSEPRPLRRLIRRGPKPPEPEQSLSLPLLREPSADEPTSKPPPASASSSSPPPVPPTPTPPPHETQLPPKIRLSAPPPPPAAVAADSPRLNAAGKVVFNGLGRSSSSPSSLAGGRRTHRGGGMERSYSAHVRVAPVLNVPVCSLRGSRKSASVCGIDRLFSPSSSSASTATASSSSNAGAAAKKARAAAKKELATAGAQR